MTQLMTIEGVAKALAVSRATVWRLVAEGRRSQGARGLWPIVLIGARATRIQADVVEEYVARSTVGAKA